jgi:glycosyltransferase involved in cell wall biosynthesis
MDTDKKTSGASLATPQDKPLISIIMPCYNAAAYIEEAVSSVFGQTIKNVELIVIDDGSTDQSLKLLASLKKNHPQILILEQTNKGPYPARNRGLEQARGEYIAFLDSDDYWADDCLEKLLIKLTTVDADLSYCGWQNIVENGENGPPYVPPAYEKEDTIKHFLNGCPWPIHAALVKKAIVKKIGGFSTHHFSSMDYDFWLRIAAVTQNITQVPEVLAYYRWHDKGQISSIKWRQVLDAWSVRKTFISANPELLAHLPRETLDSLLNAPLSRQAYEAFWRRDLVSAQKLFRTILKNNTWKMGDLKYIMLSLLPLTLFKWLVGHR